MPLRISGMKMSAPNKGFKHKTEQSKLKMMRYNPSTCSIFTTMPTVGRLYKPCLIRCCVERECCVCLCVSVFCVPGVYVSVFQETEVCTSFSSIVRQKTKVFYCTSENMLDFYF